MNVEFCSFRPMHDEIRKDLDAAYNRVLDNSYYIQGKECELFEKEDVSIVMLSSSVAQKDRKVILSDLAEKKIDIIIGTHSLFQKDVEFNNLGLVITDEEHRFYWRRLKVQPRRLKPTQMRIPIRTCTWHEGCR